MPATKTDRTVVIYWTIQGLVMSLVEGMVIAAIYGNPEGVKRDEEV